MARVLGNVLLAYACASVVTLAVVTLAHLVGPDEPGPGVLGYVVNWMGLLLVGAPVLFLVLHCVDSVLRQVHRPRAVLVGLALAPAGLLAMVALASSNWSGLTIGYVAWLLLVGLAVGFLARLPERPVVAVKGDHDSLTAHEGQPG